MTSKRRRAASSAPASSLDLTFRAHPVDASSQTTYTFSSVAIGAADASRVVVVAVTGARGAGTPSISSVTIGGVSATLGRYETNGFSASVGIYAAVVPTGTTADVVVTWDSGMNRCGLGVWTCNGLNSLTPVHTVASQADPATGTLTTVAGRPAFAVYYQRSDPSTVTWDSPMTPPDYSEIYGTSRFQSGVGVVAAGTSISVSANPSTNDTHQMVAVAYD